MENQLPDPVESSIPTIIGVISKLGPRHSFIVDKKYLGSKDTIRVLFEKEDDNFLWFFITNYWCVMTFERVEDGWNVIVSGKENMVPAQLIVAECAVRTRVHYQIRQSDGSPYQLAPRFS